MAPNDVGDIAFYEALSGMSGWRNFNQNIFLRMNLVVFAKVLSDTVHYGSDNGWLLARFMEPLFADVKEIQSQCFFGESLGNLIPGKTVRHFAKVFLNDISKQSASLQRDRVTDAIHCNANCSCRWSGGFRHL